MIKKLLKSLTVFLVILGIFFSNMPFDALSFLIDSYQKTGGIVDKIWLVEQDHNSDVVDKFISLRNISDKLRIHEAHASTFVAVSNYNNASSASAVVIKPAGTVNDDIMFAVVMRNTAAAPTTVPAGWALLGSHVNGVYQQRLYWKLAAGEGANYTWSWAAAAKTAITIAAYRGGFDIGNPIDVISNTEFVTTPNTTVRAASMNVAAPNSSLFWFGTLYSTAVRTWTKPAIPTTGWVENYDGGATTSDFSRTIDSMVWAGSGATGNMDGTVVTGGTTVKHAFAVALRPVPAPVNPDATSYINNTEGALLDGGRSSQQIIITGTNFGTVADGSQANCAGGLGTGCIRFIVGGNATVADIDITAWSNTSVTFTINAVLASYGGLASLQVVSAGNADTTPLTFYIYPNITSAPAIGQIGDLITISGDHFGAGAGSIIINTKTATVGTWGETSLLDVKIPGQEGSANITGKIQLTRADGKTSNQYPANPSNFTILAPSVSGSNPASAATGETLTIEFSGQGIDTDVGTSPTLKLTKGQPANCSASATCIIGISYLKITDYQVASVSFDLIGAVTGWWKLVIVNMDTQSGSFGDESSFGFYISALAPTVTGINPAFGNNSGIASIIYIEGNNFLAGATAKLTKGILAPINQLGPFTVQDYGTYMRMENGSFEDLTGKTLGWWNVVVTNPDLQSASYGNETDSGFEIRSALPLAPANIYQFEPGNETAAEPPLINTPVGNGIKGVTIKFRMDMEGGLTGENYFPQVELKPVGSVFTDTFTEGAGVMFNGIGVQGWVSITGIDNTSYHWQARVRNSAGVSSTVSFGGNNEPNGLDIYLDDNLPVITPGTDGTCNNPGTAAINITDLGATVQWSTDDLTSGAQNPPGNGGPYATAQMQYIKTDQFADWVSTPGILSPENPREGGILHQIILDGLVPSTSYTYRMISKDIVGNIEYSAVNCSFTTTSSRPIKTVEFFILQETAQNTGTQIAKNFSIYIPESPGASVGIKSAFIEITGISSDGTQAINVELKQRLTESDVAAFVPLGTSYAIDSTGTMTPFTILFDALKPSAGDGNQDMTNITSGASNYYYTLFLNGNGTAVSVFSAKLIITYSYAL